MATSNIYNLGNKVVTRTLNWLSLTEQAWGSEYRAPDHGVYNFQSRRYDSTDQSSTGIYNGGILAHNYLMLDNTKYPDMQSGNYLLQDNGDRIILENV